jgi:surface antigen
VNGTPAVGSIAWYASTKAAPDGHVAYVEKVNSPTSIVMSEMNYDSDNGFWVHTITRSTGDWPTDFIHVADRG